MELERRAAALEIRADKAGRRLEGYAAVFGEVADLGWIRETIRQGAFLSALGDGRDVLSLADHDAGQLLGRTKSGSLRLSEDSKGLAFELAVPDTALGRDLLALAERSDLGGMSFGFSEAGSEILVTPDRQELIRVDLREISIIRAFPAYAGTSVAARSSQSRSLARSRLEIAEAAGRWES